MNEKVSKVVSIYLKYLQENEREDRLRHIIKSISKHLEVLSKYNPQANNKQIKELYYQLGEVIHELSELTAAKIKNRIVYNINLKQSLEKDMLIIEDILNNLQDKSNTKEYKIIIDIYNELSMIELRLK